MVSAGVIIFEYICPAVGMIFANLMFSAPIKDVQSAVKEGTLGPLNPTPWAVMTGNCIGWIVYSYLIQNWFIFWANAPGLIMSIWLNMAAAKLQYCDRLSHDMRSSVVSYLEKSQKKLIESSQRNLMASIREIDENSVSLGASDFNNNNREVKEDIPQDRRPQLQKQQVPDDETTLNHFTKLAYDITIQRSEAPAPHEKVVVVIISIWLILITLISFIKLDIRQRELIIGIAVNINLSFFYGAPLSIIYKVLKERDSASIHFRTMIMNTACSLFFCLFGFGIMDYLIIVPNGIGVALGAVQLLLRTIIPNKSNIDANDDGKIDEEEGDLALVTSKSGE